MRLAILWVTKDTLSIIGSKVLVSQGEWQFVFLFGAFCHSCTHPFLVIASGHVG